MTSRTADKMLEEQPKISQAVKNYMAWAVSHRPVSLQQAHGFSRAILRAVNTSRPLSSQEYMEKHPQGADQEGIPYLSRLEQQNLAASVHDLLASKQDAKAKPSLLLGRSYFLCTFPTRNDLVSSAQIHHVGGPSSSETTDQRTQSAAASENATFFTSSASPPAAASADDDAKKQVFTQYVGCFYDVTAGDQQASAESANADLPADVWAVQDVPPIWATDFQAAMRQKAQQRVELSKQTVEKEADRVIAFNDRDPIAGDEEDEHDSQ